MKHAPFLAAFGAAFAVQLAAAADPVVQAPPVSSKAPDAATWASATRPATELTVLKRSEYIRASDGTRLAIDIYLPAGNPSKRLPTILEQTRYYRSEADSADPVASCKAVPAGVAYFVKRGYAFAIVDVRGSGASFGSRKTEFADDEVRDGDAVVNWIAAQPWSNARVGATGVSYVGTTAELLLLNHNPFVKAVAPVSAGYDFYANIDYPGGVPQVFPEKWAAVNAGLDAADGPAAARAVPAMAEGLEGPCPVDADPDGRRMTAAIAEHRANANSATLLRHVRFRDDALEAPGVTWPSPYLRAAALDAAQTPLLAIVGWIDAGYAQGGIDRFVNSRSPDQRLIIGSANHGMGFFYAPGTTVPVRSSFDVRAELLQFFDHYLMELPNGYEKNPRVRWFSTGSNIWHAANAWPRPTAMARFCLAAGAALSTGNCGRQSAQVATPGADADSGSSSRWDTILGGLPVVYADRQDADRRLLTYTSAALRDDLDVFGNPVLQLKITNTAADADYFVYLEQVDASGRAFYVGEGELRASHGQAGAPPYRTTGLQRTDLRGDARPDTARQPLTLDIVLLPLSHRFPRGSRLRIVVAGSDRKHFHAMPITDQRWTVQIGSGQSSLTLPLAARTS